MFRGRKGWYPKEDVIVPMKEIETKRQLDVKTIDGFTYSYEGTKEKVKVAYDKLLEGIKNKDKLWQVERENGAIRLIIYKNISSMNIDKC